MVDSVRHRRRGRPGKPSEDYISALPDSLLHLILSFLPTRDSVRTSVLSRRWHLLWFSVPAIDFNSSDFRWPKLLFNLINRFFASFCRTRSISRLSLTFDRACIPNGKHLCNWIDCAKSYGVEDLLLHVPYFALSKPTVRSLFEFGSSLLTLDLRIADSDSIWRSWTIILPECIRLRNVKKLSLGVCKISNEDVTRLLSCCPDLEELKLGIRFWGGDAIEIAVQSLRRLTLYSTPSKLQITCRRLVCLDLRSYEHLEYVHVDAPSLAYVHLSNPLFFGALAQRLCNVTAVNVTMENLWRKPSPQKQLGLISTIESFPNFDKLLKLEINVFVGHKFSMELVFSLLQRTSNLYSLVLNDHGKGPYGKRFDQWRNSLNIAPAPFQSLDHLKKVYVCFRSKRIRSVFLETLSERVRAWDKVAVTLK